MSFETTFDAAARDVFANLWRLNGNGGAHAHDFLEVAVISSGVGKHVTSHGSTSAFPGKVFVLRPGAWHWYVDCEDLVVANCCLSLEALVGPMAFLRFIPRVERLLWSAPMMAQHQGVLELEIDERDARDAVSVIDGLTRSLPKGLGTISRAANVLQILGHVLDHGPTISASIAWPRKVTATVELIESSPEDDWSLKELAARVGLAPSYLGRLFKMHMGMPPLGYLARVRAERAAALLGTTTLSSGQIGGLVGWPDPNHFARRFRQLSGLSPTAYREHARRSAGGIELNSRDS